MVDVGHGCPFQSIVGGEHTDQKDYFLDFPIKDHKIQSRSWLY